MSVIAQRLREARAEAGLSLEAMGALVGVPADAIRSFEEEARWPPTSTVRAYATVFGSRVERFLRDGAVNAPSALLFRSAFEQGGDLSQALGPSDLRVLGRFLSCVADAHELEVAMGRGRPKLELDDPSRGEELPWVRGRACAEYVRRELGLGDAPIPSMLALLRERLGWSVFFVTPDELSSTVEGASTAAPGPGLLINLVGGRESWWRTRASLAHEMCHVLFDTRARPYLLSPEGSLKDRGDWSLVERFAELESRANAFAAYFLVPRQSLRALVGANAVTGTIVDEVCRVFGVGRTMAVHRLGHEFGLSEQDKAELLETWSRSPDVRPHPDAALSPGLPGEFLSRRVVEAVEVGVLDTVQARSILRVPMSEEIAALGARGAALLEPESLARARAEAHGWTLGMGSCRSVSAMKTPAGWTVTIEGRRGSSVVQRDVEVSAGFELVSA
ncbi:transcriptional regulator, XRE family protein [Plesiocystis pacifica SIR-1]|uniref:Transcriptional regulator, XRE family protein n=2 Tax=Plesiocystis pacifica TaxID=191768 RepID=A6FYC4_9BACT|nr:transcriptional regulator, XRE family protein [Plesiocystis pacifica SIR-1]